LSSICRAANKNIKINPNKPVKIEYASVAWNKSPHEIDHHAIVLRDSLSAKLVRIELAETGNDTGVFVGDYVVTWSGQEFHPEVYIVPRALLGNTEQMKKINDLIQDGTLIKKPIFFQTGSRMQKISVFDTREQAIAAYEEFRRTRLQSQVPVTRETLEAQENARQRSEAKRIEAETVAQALSRQALETQEKNRQEALKAAQEKMAYQERERRVSQAANLASQGMEKYKNGDYKEARDLFARSVELDPSNETFYYQYGVSLYKSEDYNRSLVILGLAQGPDLNQTEKQYYQALNHMKLNEYESALTMLGQVQEKNDPVLSPSAAFYSGVILYQKEDYGNAKNRFEYVLDHSQDPKMDSQAENYIEQIANVLAFQREAAKKFVTTLSGGLMYDSNILLLSNSSISSAAPTDLAGFRWSYGAELSYRSVYTQTHEFSAVLDLSDMYSENRQFQASSDFQNTDPLYFAVSLPYRYKGQFAGRGYQMGLTPSFETIHMNLDATGRREAIVESQVLRNDHVFAMSENWFSTYLLELRHDQSYIASTSADNQTENRVTLTSLQTLFMDTKKTQAWIGDLAVSQNNAEGENQSYTRFDLGLNYFAPAWWNSTWTGGVLYYNSRYPKHTTGRTDNDYTLSLGLRKSLSEYLSINLTGNYILNNSTDESSDYKKYTIMAGFTWSRAF
jgi:hypothetical protein